MLLLYVFGYVCTIAPVWLEMADGVERWVVEVLKAAYPQFTAAQIYKIIKANTVEGGFALSSIVALALFSEWHFSWLRARFRFVFREYVGQLITDANEKDSAKRESMTNTLLPIFTGKHPSLDRYMYSLIKWLSNNEPTTNIDGLADMVRWMLEKAECRELLALGADARAEFNGRLRDLLCVHASALKRMVRFDIGAALAILHTDTQGAWGISGTNITQPSDIGPIAAHLLGPPGSGKTSAVRDIVKDLLTDGQRCLVPGSIFLVVASNNMEIQTLAAQVESLGICVILVSDQHHLYAPDRPRIDAIIESLTDPTRYYFIICTVHSLPQLFLSKRDIARVVAQNARRSPFGPVNATKFDISHITARITHVWLSELRAILDALRSDLIELKALTLDLLRRLCSGVRVVLGDAPVDMGSVSLACDLNHTATFTIVVPEPKGQPLVLYDNFKAWLQIACTEIDALPAETGAVFLLDRAGHVPSLADLLRKRWPSRLVMDVTAENPHTGVDLDMLLEKGALVLISPVVMTCVDWKARVNVYGAFFGGGPDAHGWWQMTHRVRWEYATRRIFLNLPFGEMQMGKPGVDERIALLERIMPVILQRETHRLLFGSVEDAVPRDIERTLRENQAQVIADNVDLYCTGGLRIALLAGMIPSAADRRACILELLTGVAPDDSVSLVVWCSCDAFTADSTHVRSVCKVCGTLQTVVPAGVSLSPLRPTQGDSPSVKEAENGVFWRPPGPPMQLRGLPVFSAIDLDSIGHHLRYGWQTPFRDVTAFVSMATATGSTRFEDGVGVSVSAELSAFADSLLNKTTDKVQRALDVLPVQHIGAAGSDLVRSMLASNGADQAEYKTALRVFLFLQDLGLAFTGEVLDRLHDAMRIPWHVLYPKNGIWQKIPWCVQLQRMTGEGANLTRWLHCVKWTITGREPPACGVGSMDQLLDIMGYLRISRMLTFLCEICDFDQSGRPLILSLGGLRIRLDMTLPVLSLVKSADDGRKVIGDVTSGLIALGLGTGVPRDPGLVTVSDLIRMLKQSVRLAFGMSLKLSKDGMLMWNFASLISRIQVLWLRLLRDPPANPSDADRLLVRLVRFELTQVTADKTPVLTIGSVVKPSLPVARAATEEADTQDYEEDAPEDEERTVSQADIDALCAFMGKPVDGFGSFLQCQRLWAGFSATERQLVLGQGGTTRERLQLQLAIRVRAKAIVDDPALPQTALGKAFAKYNAQRATERSATVNEAGSQLSSVLSNLSDLSDIGFARTRDVPEPDTESESDAEDDRPTKYSKFIDGEAGQSTQRQMQEELRLADSGAETDGYD